MELFGDGVSTPVKFFIAFVVVFALIALTAWLIRRFGSGALGQGTRGRAPRLAVIEAGAVDGRRKLVLIRRDNVEHLLMIGGPSDIVVEANIVRSQTSRESTAARTAAALESIARTAPAAEESWPAESAPARSARQRRQTVVEESSEWSLQPDLVPPSAPAPATAPRRARSADTLANLAAELNVRPAESAPAASTPAPARSPAPAAEAPRPSKPAAATPSAAPAPDQNLADMAQRLEAALRRPAPAAAAPAATPRPAPPVTPPKSAPEATRAAPPVTPPAPPAAAPAPAAVKAPDLAPASPETPAPSEKPADVFGSLEEEMANLLGRPAGKPS